MILYAANDPLVLNGTYDREGYKPGERARIAKARAKERTMQTETVTNDGHGKTPPATLAIAGVTKAVCPACKHVVTWERAEDARTTCPKCDAPLVVTATTGHTAEEAIARAAQELPQKVESTPKQRVLPGVVPKPPAFEDMMRHEFELLAELQKARALEERRHGDYKAQKKIADTLQEKLNEVIAEYADRVEAWDTEAALTPEDRRGRACLVERRTGTPCAICRSADEHTFTTVRDNDGAHRVARARDLANGGVFLSATDLRDLIADVTKVDLTRDQVQGIPALETPPVLDWLAAVLDGGGESPLMPAAIGKILEGEKERARRPTPRHATKSAAQKARAKNTRIARKRR